MAGAKPDYRVGFLQPGAVRSGAAIAYFENAWGELGNACHCSPAHAAWFEEARRRRDEFRREAEARGIAQASGGIHAIHLVEAVRSVLTPDTCLLVDGGNIGQWVHQLLCDRYPGNWLSNGRSGTVGWGIGGAMGARLAFPGSNVLLLSGDGAFTFNVADLESAVRQRLHFVALVADDQGWGILESGLGPIDFAALAMSLGASGRAVRKREELRPALERALGELKVTVLHVPIVGGSP